MKKTFLFSLIFILLQLTIAMWFRMEIMEMHRSNQAYWFSSDGPEYFHLYERYANLGAFDQQSFIEVLRKIGPLLGVGIPVLLIAASKGGIWASLFMNSFSLILGTKAVLDALPTKQARWAVICLVGLFPYTIPGLFSVNKEIYCISSALAFSAYLVDRRFRNLVLALILAYMTRYYMVVVYFTIVIGLWGAARIQPRLFRQLLLFFALALSLAIPTIVQIGIPIYSMHEQMVGTGAASNFFNRLATHGFYFFAYPLKYMMLMAAKLTNALRGNLDFVNRPADYLELVVSIFSISIWVRAAFLYSRGHLSVISRRLINVAWTSPYILMWAPTYHWRYYIFTTVFLIVALALRRGTVVTPAVNSANSFAREEFEPAVLLGSR